MLAGTHLSRASIGYEPIVGQKRHAVAMRLNVRTSVPVSVAELYHELTSMWENAQGTLLLSHDGIVGEDLLALKPCPNVWFEVPASQATQDDGTALVQKLHSRGFRMVLRGRPERSLPPALLPAFKMSVIDIKEDRRLATASGSKPPSGVTRSIPFVQSGVHTIETMERSFDIGAHAIIGWPMEDALVQSGKAKANPAYATIIELIGMIDRGEDPAAMEQLIRRDASLAYRLLRYINSPGFGLSVEVQSFRHAVMMLGYGRLKRWLALSLATASGDSNMRPVMVASFRRAVFLEHLIGVDNDPELRDEVFILGVFSLLDKLLQRPFDDLFATLNVSERVSDTLITGDGPYSPYLRLIEAIERGPSANLQDLLDECVLSVAQCNEAVIRALTAPDLINI